MTVSSSTAKVSYSGNGTTTAFAVPFYFLSSSHLLVILRSSAGTEVVQVLGTNYTVTGAGVLTGGTITMLVSPPPGTTLTISRNVPLTQETDLQPNDRLPAETLEQTVDKLTMITQQIDEAVDRSMKFPVSDATLNATLPNASERANKYLRFTATGSVGVSDLGSENVQNVKDFGAIGDGVANDTDAINAAVAAGGVVYFPRGTYKCNITVNNRVVLEGEGSTSSILKPWNNAVAIVTYKYAAMSNPAPLDFWTYHSEVRNLGFYSNTNKVGVGFAFSQTTMASPPISNHTSPPGLTAAGPADQYANNVKFYGCYFVGLEKGVLFPDGNIGSEFYSCGFSDNKYGFYTINNKFGGDAMHAGCKYFYAGMFTNNEVAVYINNTSYYGAVEFFGTIFELNWIGAYIYNNDFQITPVAFYGCWMEFNGATYAPNPANITIDVWTGGTRTTTSVAKRSWIIEGTKSEIIFNDCGIVADINLTATHSRVYLNNCSTETNIGWIGAPCTVTNASSQIINESPKTEGGTLRDDGVVTTGRVKIARSDLELTAPFDIFTNASRWWFAPPRAGISPDMGSLVASEPFITPVSLAPGTGASALTGTIVNDGRIFKQCNEFTDASFSTGEYWGLTSVTSPFVIPGAKFGTSAGWYAFTIDVKVTTCADLQYLYFYVWNQNPTGEFASMMWQGTVPSLNKWYTFAGYAYLPDPLVLGTMYFDMQGPTPGGTNTTWRLSAFQAHKFETEADAQSFLASGVYSHNGIIMSGVSDRIRADFSNATIPSRAMFQTTTTNGATRVGIIPNGTSNTTSVSMFNNESALNCGTMTMTLTNALAALSSGITGTGTYVPLDLNSGGFVRLRLNTSGAAGIGTRSDGGETSVEGSTLTVGGVYQSAANASIVYNTAGTLPAASTSSATVFNSNVATAAASFTLTDLYHFRVTGVSLGAGSAVTNEYGVHSNLAAASGKYNFYAAGTAPNLFAGSTVVGTAALATNATSGFLYVPSCAGVPTGTPATFTGTVPIVVDTTNHKLYFYSGGSWRDAGP